MKSKIRSHILLPCASFQINLLSFFDVTPWILVKIYRRFIGSLCLHLQGKIAVTLQARSSPEGSRNLRFPDYMTTTQDGGKVVSPTHRAPLPA
jgi:hypothetical protein